MQALRTGTARDGLVREMDPDAVNRQDGRSLAADDSVNLLPLMLDDILLNYTVWSLLIIES